MISVFTEKAIRKQYQDWEKAENIISGYSEVTVLDMLRSFQHSVIYITMQVTYAELFLILAIFNLF